MARIRRAVRLHAIEICVFAKSASNTSLRKRFVLNVIELCASISEVVIYKSSLRPKERLSYVVSCCLPLMAQRDVVQFDTILYIECMPRSTADLCLRQSHSKTHC